MPAQKHAWRNKDYRKKVLDTLQKTREILFFDTETTGLSAENNHIIELAAIKCNLRDDNFLEETARLHLYIKPPYMVPEKITELTGITNEQLANCPYEDECAEQIRDFFFAEQRLVCGHKVDFDIGFLRALYKRNDFTLPPLMDLDTLEMARDIIPPSDTENYKLGTLAHLCGFDEGVSFHSAMDDISVTIKLFQVLYLNYLAQEEDSGCGKEKPEILAINFWEGYRGFSRIYVDTSAGSLYYDIRKKVWAPKDADFDSIDLQHVERECWRITNCSDAVQFAKFNGRIKL